MFKKHCKAQMQCICPQEELLEVTALCVRWTFFVAHFTLLLVLWNFRCYHCLLSMADQCYGYTQFHLFMAEFTFPFRTARTIIIYYAWAALPGVENHHVHREQQSRSWVAHTWAAFEFVWQFCAALLGLRTNCQLASLAQSHLFIKLKLPSTATTPGLEILGGESFCAFPVQLWGEVSRSLLNYPFSCGDCFLAERGSRVASLPNEMNRILSGIELFLEVVIIGFS